MFLSSVRQNINSVTSVQSELAKVAEFMFAVLNETNV